MKKILLVDDNKDHLEILELVLGTKYSIRSAPEIKNLNAVIDEFEPDLVIVDRFLGLRTSLVVLDALRFPASGKAIPFFLFSAVHEIEKRAAELGAAGYISKPSSIDHIRKYVDDYFKYRFE